MMEHVYVYRVEHRISGLGAYRSGLAHAYNNATRYGDCYSHPGPWNDAGLHPLFFHHNGARPDEETEHLFFGFESLDQLRAWFPSDAGRAAMEREGGHIVVYRAPADAVHHGDRQVVFHLARAEVAGYWSLTNLAPVTEEAA